MRGDRAVEVLLIAATLGARGVVRVVAGLGLLGTTVGRALRASDVWFAPATVGARVGLRALRMYRCGMGGVGCCAILGARIGWICLDRESLWNGYRVSVAGAFPWFILEGAMVLIDEFRLVCSVGGKRVWKSGLDIVTRHSCATCEVSLMATLSSRHAVC
jgi:hypothetical protein